MKDLKALSIKQPWAYLIASGIKDIENRTWKTNFRGRVLIHTGKKYDINYPDNVYDILKNLDKGFRHYFDRPAIIGSVEIVDCVQNHSSIWAEANCWNWVLANPVLFERPILNVKGALSFFTPIIPPGNILMV